MASKNEHSIEEQVEQWAKYVKKYIWDYTVRKVCISLTNNVKIGRFSI